MTWKNLKKLQETKSLLHKERIKEKLGKQDFHYDLEEVFEPVTENQQQVSERQLQAIGQQTQAIDQQTQAIGQQTQVIDQQAQEVSQAVSQAITEQGKNQTRVIEEGIREYNENTNRHNQLLTSLVNSNQVDYSIIKTVSKLLNTKSQFRLEPLTQDSQQHNRNLFTISPHNPQPVLIKGSTMTFQNEHSYNLNDPDLQYFITITHFDREINILDTVYSFLNDMKYNIKFGDKKSIRYYFIKELFSRYAQSSAQNYAQSYSDTDDYAHNMGSGLQHPRKLSRSNSQSYARSHTNHLPPI